MHETLLCKMVLSAGKGKKPPLITGLKTKGANAKRQNLAKARQRKQEMLNDHNEHDEILPPNIPQPPIDETPPTPPTPPVQGLPPTPEQPQPSSPLPTSPADLPTTSPPILSLPESPMLNELDRSPPILSPAIMPQLQASPTGFSPSPGPSRRGYHPPHSPRRSKRTQQLLENKIVMKKRKKETTKQPQVITNKPCKI